MCHVYNYAYACNAALSSMCVIILPSSVCMYFTKYDFGLVYIIIEPDDLSSDEQGDWGVEQSVASGESSKFI